jgi:DNA replication and repair protein RecF
LQLTNFRNYRHLNIDIPSGVVAVHGDNAQGKTSLLEAIYLLSIAKAYRAGGDRQAVGFDPDNTESSANISGVVHRKSDIVRISVGMRIDTSREGYSQSTFQKSIRINGIKRSATELVGVVNAVLFDPQDIDLILGGPALRRKYLDILICQLDRIYLRSLQTYQKIVYQRNHLLRLLRDKRAGYQELDYWNEAMVNEGSKLILRRNEIVEELKNLSEEVHRRVTGIETGMEIEYSPGVAVSDFGEEEVRKCFSRALENGLDKEVAAGLSHSGPHRDDLVIKVDGRDAATFASRGQARGLAIALRLAEGAILERVRGESPIVLLDDVLSELDTLRSRRLLEYACDMEQAFVSTTDLGRMEKSILVRSTRMLVSNGAIQKS